MPSPTPKLRHSSPNWKAVARPTVQPEPMAAFGAATSESRDGAAVVGVAAAAMTAGKKRFLIDCSPECKAAPPNSKQTNADVCVGPMAMAGAQTLWT